MRSLASATFVLSLLAGGVVLGPAAEEPPGTAGAGSAATVDPPAAEGTPGAEGGMTDYQLVLLYRGREGSPMGEREIVRLQEDHLAFLRGLLEADRAVVFGPVDGGEELRGVVVLDVGSVDEARKVMERDPWVRSGRLRAEVHPWWAPAGVVAEPDNILHQSTCWLGLLLRPADAPEYSEDRLREIQAGHMANIAAMAGSGMLVMAGPTGDDSALRGIFVFRNVEAARIREAVARDPAVKAGRLGMELYPWNVPRGSLPAP